MDQAKISGAVGKGGKNAAPVADDQRVRVAAEQLLLMPIDQLIPYANNARRHGKRQIAQLRASLRQFGFVTPVLIDFDNNIIAGHGRVEAARAEGMTEVPCVLVSSLTEAKRKAYILADNRLSETGEWDPELLKIEMEGLAALEFDTAVIGFDAAALEAFRIGPSAPEESMAVNEYTRAAPGRGGFWNTTGGEATEAYQEFVDKFKPKLTTDDCYTPKNVYEAVKAWVVRHYHLEDAEIVRTFWPGGDYRGVEYPKSCVVIDNPPFSILSDICRFYQEQGVRYFLFAPALTLFSTASGGCNYVLASAAVTYENGAVVNTGFITNLGEWKIETAPDLYQLVKAADDENRSKRTAEFPVYAYPPEVLTPAACRLAKYGQTLRVRQSEAVFVRALDSQREQGKTIFGCGFLLSERVAAERAAAERAAAEQAAAEQAAAERAAAEQAAAERAAAEQATATRWTLSEREWEIIQNLRQGGACYAGTETAHGPD